MAKRYTLIDRLTSKVLHESLTPEEVVDGFIVVGQRSSAFQLIVSMRLGEEMRLGQIIVRRTF